jgi:hypothetical protein
MDPDLHISDDCWVTRTRLAVLTSGIIVASAVLGALAGWAFGLVLYNVIFDPNDTSFLANLWQAVIAFFAGLACGFAIYVVTSMLLLQKALPVELRTKGLRARIIFAPVIFAGLEFASHYITAIIGGSLQMWWAQQAVLLLLSIALVLPLFSRRTILMIAGGAFAASVVLSVIGGAQARSTYQNEYAQDVARWNGPLVLVDGKTIDLPDASWKPLPAEAAYNNDNYSSTKLQWRQYGPGDGEQNLSIDMYNSSVELSVCRYDTSCTYFASSKFGPVYEANYMAGYYVDVPGGHLEIDEVDYHHDALELINSLQVVDASTFADATKQLQ